MLHSFRRTWKISGEFSLASRHCALNFLLFKKINKCACLMLSKSLRFISVILSFQLVLFYYSHQKLCFKKSQIEKKPKFRKADLNFFFFILKMSILMAVIKICTFKKRSFILFYNSDNRYNTKMNWKVQIR